MRKTLLIIGIVLLIFQMVVLAVDIDVGGQAIDRNDYNELTKTWIVKENPANATGKITTVEIWANQDLAGAIVAIFTQGVANVFTARDSHSIGNITAGSKQTFEVDLNVVEGDFIGLYWTSGRMEWSSTGDGDWNYDGNATSGVDLEFSFRANKAGSIYGIGATTEGGEANAIFFGTNL